MHTTGKRDEEGNSWWEVKLREGRTQQIRKMFQAVGHPVSKLKRVAIGPIADPKLLPGVWRELTKHEGKLLATLKDIPAKAKPKPRRAAAKRPVAKKKPAAKTRGKKTSSRTTTRTSTRTTTRKRAARRG